MLYVSILIIVALSVFIFYTLYHTQKSNKNFLSKILMLEKIIVDLTYNLENQNIKVQLSEDLKANLQQSNNILSNKISDFNRDLPSELITPKPTTK